MPVLTWYYVTGDCVLQGMRPGQRCRHLCAKPHSGKTRFQIPNAPATRNNTDHTFATCFRAGQRSFAKKEHARDIDAMNLSNQKHARDIQTRILEGACEGYPNKKTFWTEMRRRPRIINTLQHGK